MHEKTISNNFSFKAFQAFLADKSTMFYEFDEVKSYRMVDGTEKFENIRHRLFCEPIADGEYHVDALNVVSRHVNPILGRPVFESSYSCVGYLVDKSTFHLTCSFLKPFIPADAVGENVTFGHLCSVLTDYLHKTLPLKDCLKDPDIFVAARNYAAENYIFSDNADATFKACTKSLSGMPNSYIEYLANPSTWAEIAVKAIDSSPLTNSFSTNMTRKAVAIDALTGDFISSFRRDSTCFPNICKKMYDAIKEKHIVYIVIKMNGKTKCIQYDPQVMDEERKLLAAHQLVPTRGVMPSQAAFYSLKKFLEENWPGWDACNASAFPFTSIEKILSFETKEILWENSMFKEETK